MQNPSSVIFDASFRACITDVLTRSRYQKDLTRLLAKETQFTPNWNGQEIRLENYYLDGDASPTFTGVCYELTYHVGKVLQQQWGTQFILMAADGNCPQFYFEDRTNHTFILAFPRLLFSRMVAALQQGGALPLGVYVIDPSLGVHGAAQADDAVQGYRIKYVYDFEEISPSRDRCEVLPLFWDENGYGQTHTLPLGLSQYLMPGISLIAPNELVVTGFQIKPNESPYPKVILGSKKATDSYPAIRKDVIAALPPENPLHQFLSLLQSSLNTIP